MKSSFQSCPSWRRRFAALAAAVLCGAALSGCASGGADEPTATDAPSAVPDVPDRLETDDDGVPMLSVYIVEEKRLEKMDIETYLQGVLAGEMKNDWPMEALKAQAILARTFSLKFLSEKTSQYSGADISTDIGEAQAYDASGVNENVRKAVRDTRGMVLSHGGELPYAWFHAHSGGMTALATEGLDYDYDPAYIQVVSGQDSESAPESAKNWEATFSADEVMAAASSLGVKGDALESIRVAERGKSGRAALLDINGSEVSAASLRIALGSERMRSTLLTSLKITGSGVYMAGEGFGHGVGMPQWGAYGMAEQGANAERIVTYYFRDVTVETVW